jgi:hypothetical protein
MQPCFPLQEITVPALGWHSFLQLSMCVINPELHYAKESIHHPYGLSMLPLCVVFQVMDFQPGEFLNVKVLSISLPDSCLYYLVIA